MKYQTFRQFLNESNFETFCQHFNGCTLKETNNTQFGSVKVCDEFIESLQKIRHILIDLSYLNTYNGPSVKSLFNVDIETKEDIIEFFNSTMKVMSRVHSAIEAYKSIHSSQFPVIYKSDLRKLEAFNVFVDSVNDFMLSFSNILKSAGENCIDMVLKSQVHLNFVENKIQFDKLDLSRFEVLEDIQATKGEA